MALGPRRVRVIWFRLSEPNIPLQDKHQHYGPRSQVHFPLPCLLTALLGRVSWVKAQVNFLKRSTYLWVQIITKNRPYHAIKVINSHPITAKIPIIKTGTSAIKVHQKPSPDWLNRQLYRISSLGSFLHVEINFS